MSIVIGWLCLVADVYATMVEGIVFSAKGPLAEAVVTAYPDFVSLTEQSNGSVSSPGEKPGQFQLSLVPGSYYLTATGAENQRELFSYHGLNPITVGTEALWIPFFTVEKKTALFRPGPTGIQGQVTFKGVPVANGTVSVYSLQEKNFRGMGLLTNSLDMAGKFQFDLEPGSYVIVARKRLSDSGMGPLTKQDLFCYPSANPIQVSPETTTAILIGCYPRDDLETYLDKGGVDPRGRKMEGRRAASLDDTQIDIAGGTPPVAPAAQTIISGRVLDLAGNPRAGLFVAAYPATQNQIFQMHYVRLITRYIARTDADGRYQITLDEGGSYYLVAREILGEAPMKKEYYGLYEGTVDHSITVESGDKQLDVNIPVEKIMP